jgi:hypothetical protein
MTPGGGNRQVRRIVVEILADVDVSMTAAQTARLARIFDSEIRGIFVEETELFELANLALATEIARTTRRSRQLRAEALAAETRRAFAATRRAFEMHAEISRCRVELEVARARAVQTALEAGPEDLVVYSGSLERLADAALAATIIDAANRSFGLAVLGPAGTPDGPLIALVGTAESREIALPVLRRMAEVERTDLKILVASELSVPRDSMLDVAWLNAASRKPRVMIAEAALLRGAGGRDLQRLVRRAACPVLFLNLATMES